MTPQALKASILQLAIQGKLVPQHPEEGTAEDLYQQIQAEKQRLIAEGKIKKEKPLPPIEEEKLPFDIPETWKWVRLGSCFDIATGKTPSKSKPQNYSPAQIPFLNLLIFWMASTLSPVQNMFPNVGLKQHPFLQKAAYWLIASAISADVPSLNARAFATSR